MKIFIIIASSILFSFYAFSEVAVTDVVKNRANVITDDLVNKGIIKDEARIKQLKRMKVAPHLLKEIFDKLKANISRLEGMTFTIGGAPITKEMVQKYDANQLFSLIAGNLEKYLEKSQVIKYDQKRDRGRFGEFWTTEVVYALVSDLFNTLILADKDTLDKGKAHKRYSPIIVSYKLIPGGVLSSPQLELTITGMRWGIDFHSKVRSLYRATETVNFDLKKGTISRKNVSI